MNWIQNFDLVGQYKFVEITDVFVRQRDYNVFIISDTESESNRILLDRNRFKQVKEGLEQFAFI